MAHEPICSCINSLGDTGTIVHVYLSYRDAILCYAYIVFLGVINIFLYVKRV